MNISEESQKIQIERTTPETLSIRLTGKWILDEGLPSTEETEKIIASDTRVKRIEFDAKEISAWDSGLLVFLRKIANYCKKTDIELDDTGLPKGVKKLLKLSTAVPVKETQGDPMESSMLSRIGDVSIRFTRSGTDTLAFIGEVFLSLTRWIRGKAQFRRSDMKVLLEEAGI